MTRTLVITGGHGVLGRAVLEAALAEGLNVAIIDHARGQTAPDGVLELGGVDLTDPAAAQGAMQAVADRFGGVDALLNIAGGFVWQATDDPAPAWDPTPPPSRGFTASPKASRKSSRPPP